MQKTTKTRRPAQPKVWKIYLCTGELFHEMSFTTRELKFLFKGQIAKIEDDCVHLA